MNHPILTSIVAASTMSAATSVLAGGLTIKDFRSGRYDEKQVPVYRSMADGKHYTALTSDCRSIVKYQYSNGQAVDTLLSLDQVSPEQGIDIAHLKLTGYELSEDEQRLLVYANPDYIYRRSFKADYYYYVIGRKNFKRIAKGKVQAVTLAPDGRQMVYMRDNNLYYVKVMDASINLIERPMTDDGARNRIINGVPDWVYEEEFSMTKAISWSADSRVVAYLKWDESKVKEYTLPLYMGSNPGRSEYELYPGSYTYKYPVAGEVNSDVTVWAYNVDTKKNSQMNVPLEAEGYIPRILFTNSDPAQPRRLAVMTLNRHQSDFKLFFTDANSGVSKLVIDDHNDQYINPDNMDYVRFFADGFTFMSERTGFRHLYYISYAGSLLRQFTDGQFDVTDFYGYDPKTKSAYVQAAWLGSNSPLPPALTRGIYKIDAKGNMIPLFAAAGGPKGCRGTHSASFSQGFVYMQHFYSDADTPTRVTLELVNGLKTVSVMEDNASLRSKVDGRFSGREFFSFKTSEGHELNGFIIKPQNFNPQKKYPVLMYQYSGPGSQQVLDRWECGWEQFLAQEGYVYAVVDGRGTGARGAQWERLTYMQLGVLESIDQLEAGRYVASLPFVDARRIALWGWSFGGYNTLMTLCGGNNVFKLGMAVAPVTDWKFYDSVYTERYMRTPQENSRGYQSSSVLNRAKALKGQVFVIHGSADDNVHPQNSYELFEEWVQNDIPFDMHLYTNRNHGIRGGNTSTYLYTQLYRYLQKNL